MKKYVSWKDYLSKWNSGVPLTLKELKHLSLKMEDCMDQKYWIDKEIEKKEKKNEKESV